MKRHAPRRRGPPPFANLREFASWWQDDGRLTPCCQHARAWEPGDVALLDCSTCEWATRTARLEEENRRAWVVFHQCASRFCVDTQTAGLVLSRLTAQDTDETFDDLIARMGVLYDVLVPRPKQKES